MPCFFLYLKELMVCQVILENSNINIMLNHLTSPQKFYEISRQRHYLYLLQVSGNYAYLSLTKTCQHDLPRKPFKEIALYYIENGSLFLGRNVWDGCR